MKLTEVHAKLKRNDINGNHATNHNLKMNYQCAQQSGYAVMLKVKPLQQSVFGCIHPSASCPITDAKKIPYNMMQVPPSFTIGMVTVS